MNFDQIIKKLWTPDEIEPFIGSINNIDDFLSQENVLKNFPERCYDLDRFPLHIKNNAKYSQLEVYYDLAVRSKKYSSIYMEEERKIKELFKKTWVYNSTFVYTDLSECNIRHLKKVVDPMKYECLKRLRRRLRYNKDSFITIDKSDDLEMLVELSLREKIWVIYVFSEFKVIVWRNDLSMPIYLGNSKYKELFQTMCTTEGLYLRNSKND